MQRKGITEESIHIFTMKKLDMNTTTVIQMNGFIIYAINYVLARQTDRQTDLISTFYPTPFIAVVVPCIP